MVSKRTWTMINDPDREIGFYNVLRCAIVFILLVPKYSYMRFSLALSTPSPISPIVSVVIEIAPHCTKIALLKALTGLDLGLQRGVDGHAYTVYI